MLLAVSAADRSSARVRRLGLEVYDLEMRRTSSGYQDFGEMPVLIVRIDVLDRVRGGYESRDGFGG